MRRRGEGADLPRSVWRSKCDGRDLRAGTGCCVNVVTARVALRPVGAKWVLDLMHVPEPVWRGVQLAP